MTLQWDGDHTLAEVEAAVEVALARAGAVLLRRSNDKSPTLSGEMDETGFVEVEGMEAAVGYTSEFVRKQHEHTYYRHPQGDEPKFLERALDENSEALLETIAAVIRRTLAE